ncbi:MAG: PTS sugar transporter subunit IIA [Phycisphaerales bacterium]
MRLEPYLDPNLTLILEKPAGKDAVLEALSKAAAEGLGVGEDDVLAALKAREEQMPTSTPEGVGLPHALLKGIDRTIVIPIALRPGVKFGSANHPPATLVFGMFGPDDTPWVHLRILARIARLMRVDSVREKLRAAESPAALAEALLDEDRAHA